MDTKHWLLSKVVWFNGLSLLATILETTEVINLVPAHHQDKATALVAIVNILLRFLTADALTQRAARKQEDRAIAALVSKSTQGRA